jgi:hypothetical protein
MVVALTNGSKPPPQRTVHQKDHRPIFEERLPGWIFEVRRLNVQQAETPHAEAGTSAV